MKHILLPALAACLLATPAFAEPVGNEIFVDAINGVDNYGASNPNRGFSGSPCRTIAHAISIAQDGDTIVVRPGLYFVDTTEQPPLQVNKKLHFHGDGEAVLVDSTDPMLRPVKSNQGHILLNFVSGAEGSVVEGLTFDGNNVDAKLDSSQGLVDIACSNVTVHHCVFRSGRDAGVRIVGAPNCTVADCDLYNLTLPIRVEDASNRVQILRNKVHYNSAVAGPTVFEGISINYNAQGGAYLNEAVINDNQIWNTGRFGIEVFGVHTRVQVAHNTITNVITGISFDHPTDSLIDANSIYDTSYMGIEMAGGCQRITASNNVVFATSGSAYMVVNSTTTDPSVGINVIGGQAYGGSAELFHVFAQSDVHIQGGVYACGANNTNAAFCFQGSGGNSVVGATIYASGKYDVLDLQNDTAARSGTDFRDNLVIGVPTAYVVKYSGTGQLDESVISGNHVIGTPPSGFVGFVGEYITAHYVIKDNTPSNRDGVTGFPDALDTLTLSKTASNGPSAPLILENRGASNGPGQAVGVSFRPYSTGDELALIRAEIQDYAYAPTDLEFFTNCGQAGMQQVARFGSDSNVYFLGTANSAAVHLAPVTSVTAPSSGVLIYYSAADHKLHAIDSAADHTLW